MITRQDYMDKKATHRQYYGQFVTDAIKAGVARRFRDAIMESQDPHFNDIPLKQWDSMAVLYKNHITAVNNDIGNGRVFSLCDGVCMLKEAARQIKEQSDTVNG